MWLRNLEKTGLEVENGEVEQDRTATVSLLLSITWDFLFFAQVLVPYRERHNVCGLTTYARGSA